MYESKKKYFYGTGRRKSSIARVRVYENGTGAITVNGFLAEIDYGKCIDCGKCVEKCPRHIIWSAERQEGGLFIHR